MGPLVFVLGIVGSGVLLVLLARSQQIHSPLPIGLLWLGSLWTVLAFLTLPWVTPGPAGTFGANVEWLAGQGYRFEPLQHLPALQSLVASVLSGTPEDAIRFLDTPETHVYLGKVVAGQPAYGWHVWRMSWPVKPLLSSALTLGLIASILGFVTGGVALRGYGSWVRMLGLLTGLLALVSLLIFAPHIPALNSLGSTDLFQLRLIAALGAVRVNTGVWWMCLGLLIIAGAGVASFFSVDTTDSQVEPDEYFPTW